MGKGLESEDWERDLKPKVRKKGLGSEVMKSGVKNKRDQWKSQEDREWGGGDFVSEGMCLAKGAPWAEVGQEDYCHLE